MQQLDQIAPTRRDALMALMDSLADKRILYMHAPAGCGKTVSAQLWIERKKTQWDAKEAWIRLDDYDNRSSGFCRRFTAALLALQPSNGNMREIASHPSFDTAPDEFAIQALSAFLDDGKKYIIAVDDLHVIHSAETLRLLQLFCRRLPPAFMILLLSRAAPPDAFADLALKKELGIIDAQELYFSSDEVLMLFANNGRTISEEQAADICTATGGWAIGLRALLMSDEETYDMKLTSHYLETFITEHVWEKWDIQTKEYLKKAAIVPELTPELFGMLTGANDAEQMLDALVRENSFLGFVGRQTYRFHDLFRDYLQTVLQRDGAAAHNSLMMKAGNWYYEKKDYHKAVEFYKKCGNKAGIAQCFFFMYDYNSNYASIEDTLALIHSYVDDDIIKEHLFLLETLAWAAYVEGKAGELEDILDEYYRLLPRIVFQTPRSAVVYAAMRSMDHRQSLVATTKAISRIPFRRSVKSYTPSTTQNMPFFHRSFRDLSEYAFDTEEKVYYLDKVFQPLLGKQCVMLMELLRAGLSFERSELAEAHRFALSACAMMEESYAPEMQFCALMHLAAVLEAQGHRNEANKTLSDAENMIERHGAYYLSANYRAYSCRLKLAAGDAEAARDWLDSNRESTHEAVPFYKLFRLFTSARAYIATYDFNQAIVLLTKLLALSESYRRPLDEIEAGILLAIAFWYKGKGGDRTNALEILERAVATAYEYGYMQLFINEGADLVIMLDRLHKRAVQKDYLGSVPGAFIKSLYLSAVAASKRSKGLASSRTSEKLKFTEQQRIVMRLMLDGYNRNDTAKEMGISIDGVKSHLRAIYNKLDVNSMVEAVSAIKEKGILDD